MQKNIIPAIILFGAALLSQGAVQAGAAPFSGTLRAAYAKVLEDPENLDLLYRYARIAIQEGNFEAAVGALEGMLVIARNQPRVLLELGMLYQRLGSPQVARHYLERAKAISAAGSTVASIADEYISGVDKRISPNVWSGFVKFGLRYQSNPTLAPEVDEIISGGVPIPTPGSRREESDTNAMLFSRITNRYRLNERTSLASDLVLYGTAYDQHSYLDYGLLELTSGIQWDSPQNASGRYQVRPHLLVRGSRLDHSTFEKTAGAGIDFRLGIGSDSQFNATYQYRDVSYEDYNGYGRSPLRSGDENSLDLRFSSEIKRGHLLTVRLLGRSHGAERDYFDEDRFDLTLRYSVRFRNFLFKDKPRMRLEPYVTWRKRDFGAPDPEIAPGITRADDEWRVGLNYVVPVAPTWSVFMNLERAEVDSNIVNYDVTNDLFMVGLQKGF